MKPESLVFATAGVLLGLVAGWIMGAQYAAPRGPAPAAAAQAAPPAAPAPAPAPPLNEAAVAEQRRIADQNPSNVASRVALGNLYFDAEQYDNAVSWYEAAMALDPNDADVSTDLGVSYYYLNQPDRALQQFEHSLKVDPKHTKTMLNMGIVRAFGKQDLAGAARAWENVLALAPDSPEGQAARRALEAMKSAHPALGEPAQGGTPGTR